MQPTMQPTIDPTMQPTTDPSEQPTLHPVNPFHMNDNRTLWESTSEIIPTQSTAYGEIRVGHEMSMTFDFEWLGRTTTQFEQFFRVGTSGVAGNGCAGNQAHYPSMWIHFRIRITW